MRRTAALAAVLAAAVPIAAHAAAPPATPQGACGPGSRPEPGMQGRLPADVIASGAADKGFNCNLQVVGHEGRSGGYRVHRFVDRDGHECAYYDTTLLFPLNAQHFGEQPTGVAVLDMSAPASPKRTATLVTPAMQSPHESVSISKERGLLVAVLANPGAGPGVVDVYDLNEDCRQPQLQASAPLALLGHEGGMAPDGRTFYATSLFDGDITAVDLTNPKAPVPLTVFRSYSHGMTTSDDGKTGYMASRGIGLEIMDLSEIEERKPLPQVRQISTFRWPNMSIPQTAIPVTIGGHPYVVEVDEFSVDEEGSSFPVENGPIVGAARVIDLADQKHPKVVGDMRLQVHQPENRAALIGDPGSSSFVQGYAGHYCNVPRRRDPGIVACSFIASGLRVFDIRDPSKPKEIAYFLAPPSGAPVVDERSNYAMAQPEFVPERGEIWYSDGNSGFYALRVANGLWPFKESEACLRPATIGFRLHRVEGTRVVRVDAYVNGERTLVRTGRDLRRVELTKLARTGRLKVRIVATHNTGSKVVSTRSWNGCLKGKPSVRRIPRPR
ncbi:MAG TPA: hypothetical protein VF712_15680 [Thermoleophilaceae bacterium]|jgi:hypothetical protein